MTCGWDDDRTERRTDMQRPVFERLIHVPGPNPIITEGKPGDWDDAVIEAGNVIKDHHTYYFYYHGIPKDNEKWGPGSYRVGVATAAHPLGPWKKYGDAPVLNTGAEESGMQVSSPARPY